MKMKKTIPVKMLMSVLTLLICSSCMPMGMHGGMMKPMMSGSSDEVQFVNMSQVVDEMIEEAVLDLSSKDLDIASIAVWRIKSHTAGLNVEMIRQSLITRLVMVNEFKVLSRERLEELLLEQSLSLSGVIDEKSAVDIGHLIGVEAFMDGHVSLSDNRLVLSLKLVDTESGVIVWAKTIERDVR